MEPTPKSRRRLLYDLGIAGLATGGFVALATGDSVAYQRERVYQTDAGADLRVEWASTYNGAVLGEGTAADTPPGPMLSLSNVVPGDEGALALRVGIVGDDETSGTYEIVLRGSITDESDHRTTEPERAVGDTTSEGDLGEFVHAELWDDRGSIGGCNGEKDVGEAVIASGTLRQVGSALSSGVRLTNPARDSDCFGIDETVCLGIRWWFPETGPADNVAQGDSLEFSIGLGATDC